MGANRRNDEKLYMAVTADKFELPLGVADTAADLGKMFGKTEGYIYSFISHQKSGSRIGTKFIRVDYDGEEAAAIK